MAQTTAANAPISAAAQAQAMRVLPETARVARAGFVTRAVALMLDIIIVSIGSVVVAGLTGLILNFFGISTNNFVLEDSVVGILGLVQLIIVAVSVLAVLFFVPGYFVFFWVVVGATPGKQLLGIQVRRTNGNHVGWLRGIIRFIGYFISAIVFFLGFLWVLIDKRRQGWHDKLADTCVVYTWDVPPGD
jgi:uncharacterized RDD family membrane protein YckC